MAIAFDLVRRPVEEPLGSAEVEPEVKVEPATLVGDQRRRVRWAAANQVEITSGPKTVVSPASPRVPARMGRRLEPAGPRDRLIRPLPERIAEAERWQAVAGALEAQRSCWNIGAGHLINPDLSYAEQWANFDDVATTVGSAGFLDHTGPAISRPKGTCWLIGGMAFTSLTKP